MRLTCSFVLFACLLLVTTSAIYAQAPDALTGCNDFVLRGKTLILLTKTGKLTLIGEASREPGLSISTDAPIVALNVDRQGAIVVGDTNHLVKSYNVQQKTWHVVAHYPDKLTNIIFNSQNQCFLITNKGIVDAVSHATYFPDSSLSKNNQIRYRNGWFQPPVCFIDHLDNLWLGFDHGEWGGDVFVFDTQKRVFSQLQTDRVKMTMNPVSAFCEDQQYIYMSGGLSHMMLTHGSIIKFTKGIASPVLLSEDRKTPTKISFEDPKTGKKRTETETTWTGGERIGPVTYNPVDNCLYFYSQNGIYKGRQNIDLSNMSHWKNILKPKLSWTGGRNNAVGPAMNVLKMQFTADGKLLFLTEHEGLGIYDGKNVQFIP